MLTFEDEVRQNAVYRPRAPSFGARHARQWIVVRSVDPVVDGGDGKRGEYGD
jgi:hypothetical protein